MPPVKKRRAYILFFIFIFHLTAFDQLLKLPNLVTHYLEHQERDCHISVMDFLCMHYWGKDIDDNDEDRDRELPYKTVDVHALHHSFVPLAKAVTIKQQDYSQILIDYPILKDNYLPEPTLKALFKPPRA